MIRHRGESRFRRSWIAAVVVVVVVVVAGAFGSVARDAAAVSPYAQVGVGAPPVTSVDQLPDVAAPTTTSGGGPIPVMGASTSTSVVVAGPTTTVPPTILPSVVSTSIGVASTVSSSLVVSSSAVPTTTQGSGVVTTRPPATSVDELRTRVSALLAGSTASRMGVFVVVDGDGPVLFERNADRGLVPASTQKIYVAGAALSTMGPDARFITEVLADGAIAGGVLSGDLVLHASGDPTFSATQLTSLASSVRSTGVSRVSGSLVLDDARYDRVLRVGSWKPSFTPGESGWLSAFSVDGNHRNDAATLADPALANLERFRAALGATGITVSGASRRGVASPSAVAVGVSRSQPLQDIVRSLVKRSDNTYAELLTKELGARLGSGSTANGVTAIANYFAQLKVSRPETQEDGSGLSSNNRSSPRTQVVYLQRALASPIGAVLRSSFAVSCVDGTLRSRTCGTAASGKVLAKSGAIDNVVALSGVTTTASGRPVTFSFLMNGVRSPRLGRSAIDAVLVEVVRSTV